MTEAPAMSVAAAAARAVAATKTYGSGPAAVHALAGVSVEFPAHRYTAIMGPSGSGKSTLMQCVAGLDRLTPATAFIGETRARPNSTRRSSPCCAATASGSSSSSTT